MTTESANGYTGKDNLEVMREARNYNAFLVNLVVEWSGSQRAAVDFGAGSGTFAQALREAGMDVRCIEPDPTLATSLASLDFDVHADLTDIPDGSVGYVYSLNVLEHIPDDAGTVKRQLGLPGVFVWCFLHSASTFLVERTC